MSQQGTLGSGKGMARANQQCDSCDVVLVPTTLRVVKNLSEDSTTTRRSLDE